ncbi:hypothetical protein GUJ93_ZPchr0007g4741 [Zizania palustris]|uniref:Pectinesterase inhibitor domain-containing protein n=1 Tax=Zizania palustris TaxID=103762 RepID=A0A8J5W593_ZIZPA|nr:hypothetical protein GUJ93_ZPchr0007g4741 [Zizania palustris]
MAGGALHVLSAAAIFLLLLVPHGRLAAATPSSPLLHYKCAIYAAGDRPSCYNYCVRMLRSDRASATADAGDLAVIAARIARATAKATDDKIARLQGAETVPAWRDGLAVCAAEYAAAVRRLGRASKDDAHGVAPERQEALRLLGQVLGAPERCQVAFEAVAGRQGLPPMSSADWDLDDIVGLVIAIL